VATETATLRGLTAAEVAERVARGQVNDVPAAPTRTVWQIVRANVFTRFNALLGGMLAIILVVGPVQDAPTEEWRRMVNVNLLGLLYCAHAALPHLLRAAGGGPRQVADLVNISSVAGRVARNGSGVYNATKHGDGAFSEALRQEVTRRHVRVSLVEPGATSTELASHNRPEIRERMGQRFAGMERLEAADIAETIAFIVTRPRRMAVNEVLVRPTEQEG
jgi:NADP-dependent 3-hydroxy acid dehydrogenase YdfG